MSGEICPTCKRGQEACEWCHDFSPLDYETLCDCGLYDHGYHLLDCHRRRGYRWVVAESYESAGLLEKA